MLRNKNILVGVSGGIAAYKVVEVVSRLKKQNANVDIIMTKHATEFVSELTFRTLSLSPVYIDMFDKPVNYDVEHISLAEKADLFLLAPATANIIGKIANGIADDLLTTTVMASKAKKVFAPAMNTNMYLNPITQNNIEKLKSLNYEFISPGFGMLACQTVGPGRMAEPEDIVNYIIECFNKESDLKGKKIVITAGPTIEEIDPVRYITNYSSGKMGYAIAIAARDRGAEVVLVSGPTKLERPTGLKIIDVKSTNDMLKAIEDEFDNTDILIKAAAVSDYRVKNRSDIKIKKDKDAETSDMTLELVENVDIAGYFGMIKDNRIMVGFAAETNDLIENSRKKIKNKNLDFIVANDVTVEGAGFDIDTNIVKIIDNDEMKEYPKMLKSEVADIILDKVVDIANKKAR